RFERIDQGGGRSEGVGLTVDLNFHGVTSRRNEREWPQRWDRAHPSHEGPCEVRDSKRAGSKARAISARSSWSIAFVTTSIDRGESWMPCRKCPVIIARPGTELLPSKGPLSRPAGRNPTQVSLMGSSSMP